MSGDDFPRRASSDTRNPHFHPSYRRIGVLFNDVARNDVNEYDLDDGWIDVRERLPNGKWRLGADGRYVVRRLVGKVEVYIRHKPKPDAKPVLPEKAAPDTPEAVARLEAAEAKRARKAAKLAALAERRAP